MADEPPPPALARKSAPAQPWSHVETMHLIDAYEERWTALRRGQLKAHQWEEVATEVAARCAANPGVIAQRKTGTQCRHKLEKLRKRYRTEGARPVTSLWPYFRRMDRLERGALAAYPAAASSPPAADGDEEEDEEDVQEEEEVEELVPRNNTRSINGIIREFGIPGQGRGRGRGDDPPRRLWVGCRAALGCGEGFRRGCHAAGAAAHGGAVGDRARVAGGGRPPRQDAQGRVAPVPRHCRRRRLRLAAEEGQERPWRLVVIG
uniref:Myb/SANT-like DNA-binding domain-containing protein n=1 Tax=Zea mays TaxID=4577 RepID=A0A804P041_MAIZE